MGLKVQRAKSCKNCGYCGNIFTQLWRVVVSEVKHFIEWVLTKLGS